MIACYYANDVDGCLLLLIDIVVFKKVMSVGDYRDRDREYIEGKTKRSSWQAQSILL